MEGDELMDQLFQEHVEWVEGLFGEPFVPEWEYHLMDFNRAAPDTNMMNLYLDAKDCAESLSEYSWAFIDVPYREVSWYLFGEGWTLNNTTHVGKQIRGLVLAGRHVFYERGSLNRPTTVVHEMMHVLYPRLWHTPEFYLVVRHCTDEVW